MTADCNRTNSDSFCNSCSNGITLLTVCVDARTKDGRFSGFTATSRAGSRDLFVGDKQSSSNILDTQSH